MLPLSCTCGKVFCSRDDRSVCFEAPYLVTVKDFHIPGDFRDHDSESAASAFSVLRFAAAMWTAELRLVLVDRRGHLV